MKTIIKTAVLFLAALGALPAAAQVGPVHGTLSAPMSLLPAQSVITYNYGAPNVTFVWDQYPAMRSQNEELPNHFLLCLRRNIDGPCSHASAVANLLPSSLSRTALYSGSFIAPVGYRYTYTPLVPDDRLDRQVRWQVAGCLNANDSSCKFSASTNIVVSSIELRGGNLSANVMGNQYFINAEGANSGSRNTPGFNTLIYSWEVLVDAATGTCRSDPNAVDLRAELSLYVIDNKGKATQFSQLRRDPAGNYVVSNIIAIYRPNSTFNYRSIDLPNTVLAAGASNVSVGTLVIPLPAGRPRAFVSAVLLDNWNAFLETDEANNSRAECEVVF